MIHFGDYEPEDAWDNGDDLEAKVTNLERRMDLVEGDPGESRQASRLVMVREDFSRLDRVRIGPVAKRLHDLERRIERAAR